MLQTAGYTQAELIDAVGAAVRAPSMHNSQPWRFRLADGAIEVRLDEHRPPTGGGAWAALVSCGAAVFNLRLALAVTGHPARVAIRPDPNEPTLVARLLPDRPRPPSPREQALFDAIPRRFSHRRPFFASPVPPQPIHRLVEAAHTELASLAIVVGGDAVAVVAEIAHSAQTVLMRDPVYAAALAAWIRAEKSLDGIDPAHGGPAAEPHDLLPQRPFGQRTRAPGRDYEAEPVIAVLGTAGDTPSDRILAGEALEAVLLTATDAGLSVSMLSQPIEAPAAREQLRRALGMGGSPQMVLRIGYGEPGVPSGRRPVLEVVDGVLPPQPGDPAA